jgi:F-type H+-transporting ATPase subunit epsilon
VLRPSNHRPGKLTLTQPRHISVPRLGSYNKYTQIASRAVRTGLKESERVGAEKRANIGVKYQQWENGKGGEQVSGRCWAIQSSGNEYSRRWSEGRGGEGF